MKTHILRLEPHDDVISTRDKMGWGKSSRILLVWPARGRILERRLDLVLLQRHSVSLGSQLALVTSDSLVRAHAAELGIPVFNKLRQAQSAHWRVPRPERKSGATLLRRPPHPAPSSAGEIQPDFRQQAKELRPSLPDWLGKPAARLTAFSLGVLAVLALTAALLPGAEIGLAPRTQPQHISLEVRADPQLKAINLSGAVPASALSVIVEGRGSLPSSGVLTVADQPARGQVVFTNLTEQAQNIPAGSIVRSTGIDLVRFITTQSGSLPAGTGQAITLTVQSVLPGVDGNLPAGSLSAIEGPLGLDVTASNPEATRGGSQRRAAAPTDSDREKLTRQLEQELRATALAELQSQLAAGDLLFSSTLTMTQVLEAVYSPAVQPLAAEPLARPLAQPPVQPADQLNLRLRLEFQALHATQTDLHALGSALLEASLPEGYHAVPDTLKLEALDESHLGSTGLPTWQMRASRTVQAAIPPAQAAGLVVGLPPAQALQRLVNALPLQGAPTIRLIPSWWPRLPLLPFRISISP